MGSEGKELLESFFKWFRATPKALSIGLMLSGLGFLLGLLTSNGFFWLLFWIGLLLLSWQTLKRLVPSISLAVPRVLSQEQVLEQWGTLIGGAQGRAERVLQATEQFITAGKAPDVDLQCREIGPSWLRGMLGGRRPFLIIFHTKNSNLKSYRMYINSREYGNNLQVSWYLVYQLTFWQIVMMLLMFFPVVNLIVLPFQLIGKLSKGKESGFLGLDLFDLQDLTAYVTNAHHCLLDAVDQLLMELNQDPTKIDRKSKGFLGIS